MFHTSLTQITKAFLNTKKQPNVMESLRPRPTNQHMPNLQSLSLAKPNFDINPWKCFRFRKPLTTYENDGLYMFIQFKSLIRSIKMTLHEPGDIRRIPQ